MTALVVDDEAGLRALVSRILRRHGYQTIEADSGAKALQLFSEHSCDVVITDVSMPEMSGPEFVARMKRKGSAAPYLFISGYSSDETLPEPGESAPFLAKPFTAAELMAAVNNLFGTGPAQTAQTSA